MLKRQDYFLLGAAFLSFLFSVSLWFGVIGPPDHEAGIFVEFHRLNPPDTAAAGK